MFTMAEAIRVVPTGPATRAPSPSTACASPSPSSSRTTTKGALIEVSAKVAAKLDDDDRTVRVDITATSEGQKVLGMARAVVRLA